MSNNSVDWLFLKLWNTPKDKLNWNAILNQAKEMHKEEIIEAFNYGLMRPLLNSTEYYNETFGGNNEQ